MEAAALRRLGDERRGAVFQRQPGGRARRVLDRSEPPDHGRPELPAMVQHLLAERRGCTPELYFGHRTGRVHRIAVEHAEYPGPRAARHPHANSRERGFRHLQEFLPYGKGQDATPRQRVQPGQHAAVRGAKHQLRLGEFRCYHALAGERPTHRRSGAQALVLDTLDEGAAHQRRATTQCPPLLAGPYSCWRRSRPLCPSSASHPATRSKQVSPIRRLKRACGVTGGGSTVIPTKPPSPATWSRCTPKATAAHSWWTPTAASSSTTAWCRRDPRSRADRKSTRLNSS